MNRLFNTVIIFLLCINTINAETYIIKKLNTPYITIGSEKRIVGSEFESGDVINWNSKTQSMWVKCQTRNSHRLLHFSCASFNNKDIKTIDEYFNKINHPSVRDTHTQSPLEGHNKDIFSESRLALVIGISNYKYLEPLNNPINDAFDISEKLRDLGFDVLVSYDVSRLDFDTSLNRFARFAKGYDVVLLYYAGHGIQFEKQDYLVPLDVELSSSDNLDECIDLQDVYYKLNTTGCPTKFVFIDACRTEPEWKRQSRLDHPYDVSGIKVVYSTSPNSFAFDGDKRNSPFAESFLMTIDKPAPDYLTTIGNIARYLNQLCPGQEVHDWGASNFEFTFVKENPFETNIDYSKMDITHLEQLANGGDVNSYIPIAEYWLKNDASIIGCETAYRFAMKAWNANIRSNATVKIFKQLEALGFFIQCDCKNPLLNN